MADGLVGSWGDPHPAMREVAWVYRPVTVTRTRTGGLRVHNRQSFTGLQWLRAEWELLVDGRVVRRGTLATPQADPHRTVDVPLPCDVPDGDGEVHLTVRWRSRSATSWCAAGHLIAWDQVTLRSARRRTSPPVGGRRGSSGEVERLLTRPVELSIWRAATDNDGFKLLPDLRQRIGVGGTALQRWLDAGIDHLPAEQFVQHRVRRVEFAGAVEYHHTVEVPTEHADLPRIGATFAVPARFTEVHWFGRGPHENYPDRNASAVLGTWQQRPDELPYLVPQEFGLRTDCRWFELVDPKRGQTVRVDVLQPAALHCSATRATAEALYDATTATEFATTRDLVVHLDVAHRGLGTASCGPDVLPRYRIGTGTFRFAYRLSVR